MKLSCVLWGHHVDNRVFASGPTDRHCQCGTVYLGADGTETRVRHTLACFLGHHTYTCLTERDGCREYVCVQCGHPLLFRADADPYGPSVRFKKRVRYLCGLFGHRVSVIANRDGGTEYACHCGHTFLTRHPAATPVQKIRHPLICVFFGHFVRYVTSRRGYDEFVCDYCGHPFCFAQGRADARRTELASPKRSREGGLKAPAAPRVADGDSLTCIVSAFA